MVIFLVDFESGLGVFGISRVWLVIFRPLRNNSDCLRTKLEQSLRFYDF